MKRKTVFRMTPLRLLACFLGFTATYTLAHAQQETKSETKPKLSLAVLVDTSAHQQEVIEFEREAIDSIAGGFADFAAEAFAIRYADEVELLQDWSPIGTGLRPASARIELDVESGKNHRTLLYEALHTALLKLNTASGTNSKVLIIVGEGNNAGGEIKYSEIKKLAQSAGVQCFALLVADHNLMGGRVRHFGFDLYDLASATKGKAYDIERSRRSLDKALEDVPKRVHWHRNRLDKASSCPP